MKTFLLYFFILFSAFTFSSCEKQELPPDSEQPKLITLDATFNGAPINLAAGNIADFAYNLTTYYPAPDSIWVLSATLEDTNRAGVGYFRFSINNYKHNKGSLKDDIEHAVKEGSYQYENSSSNPITGKVCIQWGKKAQYLSTYDNVQPGSKFEISRVETFMKNGLKYRKATIIFNCKLGYTGNTQDFNGTAVMVFVAVN